MRKLLVQVGVAAAVAFGLVGCGGGGDPAAPQTSATTATAPTGAVAGADTPEGQAFCDEAKRVLSESFAVAEQAYEDFFAAEAGSDEWLAALDETTQTSLDAYDATVGVAASAPTPELKAVLDDIAAQIEIQADGSSERPLSSEAVTELLGQLDTACGR